MASVWRFSEGTSVELGGKVRGASDWADRLRQRLPAARVEVGPRPSPSVEVDPSDATLLDAWLVSESRLWPWRSLVTLESRPDGITPLPEWQRPDDVPVDAVF